MLYLYVAVGGAFGALMRFVMSGLLTQAFGKQFPYATLCINVLGSLLMGVLVAVLVLWLPRGRELHALLAIGALGGFTTFSTFAYESYLLLERGELAPAMLYIAGSVVLSIVGFFLGMWLIKLFTGLVGGV